MLFSGVLLNRLFLPLRGVLLVLVFLLFLLLLLILLLLMLLTLESLCGLISFDRAFLFFLVLHFSLLHLRNFMMLDALFFLVKLLLLH